MHHRIVVIGAGFAGLTAIKTLRAKGCKEPITLISPSPEFFYYPSLIWVPAGLRNEADLTIPLDKFLERHQIHFHQGKVTKLDPQARQIFTDTGTVAFDSLIIASGGRFLKKVPGIEHIFTPCEGYAPTYAFSEKLASLSGGTIAFGFGSNPKEPAAMRGGPIFEFLFGIDTLLRQQYRRDKFRLIFFNPALEPGKRLGSKAVTALLGEMAKRNIGTHLGYKIKEFTEDAIITEGGKVYSDLTLFMPGMTGPVWATESGLPLSEGGFIKADAQCRIPGFTGIYIAGDSGSFPGPDWLPKQAHIADLQARTAVNNLLADKNGQKTNYQFKTELICIVDALDGGMLVYRDIKRSILLPKLALFSWAKRWFEQLYLQQYR